MTVKEYAARLGIEYRKAVQAAGKIPGAIKEQDAMGRWIWNIPESAAPPPDETKKPAGGEPPAAPFGQPPEPEPTEPGEPTPPRKTHGPTLWIVAGVVLMIVVVKSLPHPRMPPGYPFSY